ncbi:MAG TPA: sporulation protein YunB [Lachnospiraceae bacterium]|jgi:sporulation protein YunB|nr:sporulation protein YunB [Lachnospiraceae bacterium]
MQLSRKAKKRKVIIRVVFLMVAFIFFFSVVEQSVMPSLIAIGQVQAKQAANNAIDTAVRTSITNMGLKTEDFFTYTQNGGNISANTLLINELCAEVSKNINSEMQTLDERKISVAIGALTGWDALANCGPRVSFKIRQMGEADVDYQTEFAQAGINQTNYKAWLTVNLMVHLVNPIKAETTSSQRKVMLIDTVIEGKIPNNYLEIK